MLSFMHFLYLYVSLSKPSNKHFELTFKNLIFFSVISLDEVQLAENINKKKIKNILTVKFIHKLIKFFMYQIDIY